MVPDIQIPVCGTGDLRSAGVYRYPSALSGPRRQGGGGRHLSGYQALDERELRLHHSQEGLQHPLKRLLPESRSCPICLLSSDIQ